MSGFLLLSYRCHGGRGFRQHRRTVNNKEALNWWNECQRESTLFECNVAINLPLGNDMAFHLNQLDSLVSVAALCQVWLYM